MNLDGKHRGLHRRVYHGAKVNAVSVVGVSVVGMVYKLQPYPLF